MADVPVKPNRTDNLFKLVSVLGGPFIGLMVMAPHARLTQRVMKSNLVFIFYSGLYTILMLRFLVKRPDLASAIMRMDVDAIAAFVGDRNLGVLTVWTHMTASDLFISRWMYLDSLERGTVARLPLLIQTVFGPIGLLVYLLTRGRPRANWAGGNPHG